MTTVRHRVTAHVVVGLSLTLLAACGGGAADEDGPAAAPTCMASLTPASLPKDGSFPADWPFPPGTVLTRTERVPGGGLAVTAHVDSDFEKVLPFMQHDVEDAGFVASRGEAEHDDAEATWAGEATPAPGRSGAPTPARARRCSRWPPPGRSVARLVRRTRMASES